MAVPDPPAAPNGGDAAGHDTSGASADRGDGSAQGTPEDGSDDVAAEDDDAGAEDGTAPGDDTPGAGGAVDDGDDILAGTDGLYVPPTQAAAWVEANTGDPRADVIATRIADVPSSTWFTGGAGVAADADRVVTAAAADNTVPVLVAYNVPGRDCGEYSAGGASDSDAYRAWVDAFARAIGDRPAIVILEPDALAGMDCLSAELQADRMALLRYAVNAFHEQAPNTWTTSMRGTPGGSRPRRWLTASRTPASPTPVALR